MIKMVRFTLRVCNHSEERIKEVLIHRATWRKLGTLSSLKEATHGSILLATLREGDNTDKANVANKLFL